MADDKLTPITPEAQMAAFRGFSTHDGEVTAQQEGAAEEPPEQQAPAEGNQGQQEQVENKDGQQPAKDKDQQSPEKDEKHRSAQQRIDRERRLRGDVERALDRERGVNEELREQIKAMNDRLQRIETGQLTPGQQQATLDPDKKPVPADYQFGALDEQYVEDLSRYHARQNQKTSQEAAQSAEKKRTDDQLREEWEGNRDKFNEAGIAKYPDFDEVVIEPAEAGEFPVSYDLAAALMTEEYGIDVAYELAGNLDEAKRVSKMTTARQLLWLGKRQAHFAALAEAEKSKNPGNAGNPSAGSQNRASGAPKPLDELPRGGRANGPVTAATTDFSAFEAMAMNSGRKAQ